MTTATPFSLRVILTPKKESIAKRRRREIIAASPRSIEIIEGREWVVVRLPDPGEVWVTSLYEEYASANGDETSAPGAADEGEGLGGDFLD